MESHGFLQEFYEVAEVFFLFPGNALELLKNFHGNAKELVRNFQPGKLLGVV